MQVKRANSRREENGTHYFSGNGRAPQPALKAANFRISSAFHFFINEWQITRKWTYNDRIPRATMNQSRLVETIAQISFGWNQ
jgi:hypothetical protein